MPKDIIFPPLSEVVTDVKNNSVSVLKFPKSFESVVYLDLPVVINSKLDIVLDGPKLDKKPYDVDLDYVYFNDLSTTSNSNYTFGNYVKTSFTSEKIINYDATRNIKSRKFVSEEEEIYENNIISRGTEVVPKDEPLVGQFVNLSNVMHLFHNNVLGSNLIFEDFTVDFDNVIKMKYKNYGSNKLVLHKPISMEPLIPPQDFFKTEYNQIVKCFGNKVLVCSKRFGLSNDGSSNPYIDDFDEIHVHTVTNGQITSSENISNVATFRCTDGSTGFAGLSNVITWSNPIGSEFLNYGTFAACENIVDADEYFVAFTTYNNKVIFYDSKTGWENKTGTSIVDTPDGLSPGDFSFTYRRDTLNINSGNNISEFKRPMSIKHFQSTGNVHALVCGASSNSCPTIAKSTDNLETFVHIFNEGNLSAFNITPYGSNNNEKSRYDTQTDTKIINENTFYVETGLLGKYDDGATDYTFPLKLFLKTTDGGSSWVDIMEDHLEYRTCGTSTSFISEDGQDIYVAIFYHDPSSAYVEATLKNKIQTTETFPSNMYPSTTDRIILFNYSTDGGASWRYTSGNWKAIDYQTLSSVDINENIWSTDYTSFSSRSRGNMPFIFRNKNTGHIIMSYVWGSQSEWAYLSSTDNGNTWNYYLPGTSVNPTIKIPVSSRPLLRFEAESSTRPVAPYDYTDEHVVHIGNHKPPSPPKPTDPGDPNTVYNSHELLFTIDYDETNLDLNRLPRSMIVMSKLIDSVPVDVVKGSYT